MRLIDADALIKELQESKINAFGPGWQRQIQIADKLIDILNEAPTANEDLDYLLILLKDEDCPRKELIRMLEKKAS